MEFLDYPDGMVEYGLPLRRDIASAIRRHKPDVVVTMNFEMRFRGGGTNQSDHRAVGLATLDASRDAGNRWIFTELVEDGLDPWNEVRMVLVGASPNATHAVDVGDHIYRGGGIVGEARHLHQGPRSGLRPRDVPDDDRQCCG